jgi:hypothetical protein
MVVAARALGWSPGAAGRATVVSPIQCLLDGLAALLLPLCVLLCHDFLRRVDCFWCLSIGCAGAPRSGGGGGGRGFVMAGSQSVGSGGRRILDADCRDEEPAYQAPSRRRRMSTNRMVRTSLTGIASRCLGIRRVVSPDEMQRLGRPACSTRSARLTDLVRSFRRRFPIRMSSVIVGPCGPGERWCSRRAHSSACSRSH